VKFIFNRIVLEGVF